MYSCCFLDTRFKTEQLFALHFPIIFDVNVLENVDIWHNLGQIIVINFYFGHSYLSSLNPRENGFKGAMHCDHLPSQTVVTSTKINEE